jgi:hypothetical protein
MRHAGYNTPLGRRRAFQSQPESLMEINAPNNPSYTVGMALTERRTFVADRSGCVWGPGMPPDPTTIFPLETDGAGHVSGWYATGDAVGRVGSVDYRAKAD